MTLTFTNKIHIKSPKTNPVDDVHYKDRPTKTPLELELRCHTPHLRQNQTLSKEHPPYRLNDPNSCFPCSSFTSVLTNNCSTCPLVAFQVNHHRRVLSTNVFVAPQYVFDLGFSLHRLAPSCARVRFN